MVISSKPIVWINMSRSSVKSVVIVGGGTAGWLTAGLLGAKKDESGAARFHVTLIEPTGIPPIGVGEGTWPSMRLTLSQIGVSERDFFKFTGASFKQGTKFKNWKYNKGEYYYHPFDKPKVEDSKFPLEVWKTGQTGMSFARYVGVQEDLCEAQRSPKQHTSRDFAGVTNYGYHFEADGMAAFLKEHCKKRLNVTLIPDKLTALKTWEDGRIKAVTTQYHGNIEGDFFVDCTGFQGLIIKRHFKAHTISLGSVFSCDRAIVARIPYHENAKIESTTLSTAQEAGWIWDVSLAKRFGLGYVHSSAHINANCAQEVLSGYITQKGYDPLDVSFRELKFTAGYVDKCWHKNCAAIGLSSGFVEPLEASSIMMTETAARELAENLSSLESDMTAVSKLFNSRFKKRWEQVTHFLKLHYTLSQRQEDFWVEHRHVDTIPKMLLHDISKWKKDGWVQNLCNVAHGSECLFPLDSYKFVFHAMDHHETNSGAVHENLSVQKRDEEIQRYLRLLPTNREWLSYLS